MLCVGLAIQSVTALKKKQASSSSTSKKRGNTTNCNVLFVACFLVFVIGFALLFVHLSLRLFLFLMILLCFTLFLTVWKDGHLLFFVTDWIASPTHSIFVNYCRAVVLTAFISQQL